VGIFAWIAAPIAAAVALIAAYLGFLSAAALLKRGEPPPQTGHAQRRFAILVPAHDEASVIERLLRTLRAQRYPRERFDVFVVADNCTDATAALARGAGALVHERHEPQLRAKGHALRWLLERVRERGAYDAYVVFDADSEVAPDFLLRMDARLAAGSLVIQSHYRVLNSEASAMSALRQAALASLHYLRPLGRAALGLSCGLKGNGMCFDASTLDRYGWTSVGLAEDVELHLELVRRGVRVDFAPEAVVRADMPLTLGETWSQNVRWEAGRLATVRRRALPLLYAGAIRRNAVLVDAAAEQLIPPLSVAVSAGLLATLLAIAGGNPYVAGLALCGTGGIALHIFVGLAAVRAPFAVYRALLVAPVYVGWKLMLYARAMTAPASHEWIRTTRPAAPDPESRLAKADG
jgi:cellulose synthase/poly-beta-1,6-N-acetylglucosamine synthase-like glycosyltransferase